MAGDHEPLETFVVEKAYSPDWPLRGGCSLLAEVIVFPDERLLQFGISHDFCAIVVDERLKRILEPVPEDRAFVSVDDPRSAVGFYAPATSGAGFVEDAASHRRIKVPGEVLVEMLTERLSLGEKGNEDFSAFVVFVGWHRLLVPVVHALMAAFKELDQRTLKRDDREALSEARPGVPDRIDRVEIARLEPAAIKVPHHAVPFFGVGASRKDWRQYLPIVIPLSGRDPE